MADLNCTVEKPPKDEKPYTVGDRFAITCSSAGGSGESAPAGESVSGGTAPGGAVPGETASVQPIPQVGLLNLEKTELRLDEKDKYVLKLFKVEKAENGDLRLLVTSYKVGDHKLQALQLVDDSHAFVMSDLEFQVASVQNPQEPRTEPYPPFGPLRFFPWPIVLVTLAMVILMITPFVVIAWRRRLRRVYLREVDSQAFQYPAFQDLHRSLRQLQRKYPFLGDSHHVVQEGDQGAVAGLKELREAFDIYLMRSYRLPVKKWGRKQILRTLESELPNVEERHLNALELTLKEFEKAEKQSAKLAAKDVTQIMHMIRRLSDDLHALGEVSR